MGLRAAAVVRLEGALAHGYLSYIERLGATCNMMIGDNFGRMTAGRTYRRTVALETGSTELFEGGNRGRREPAGDHRMTSRVRTAGLQGGKPPTETLSAALQMRRELADDESVITRSGEWIGRDWLRVNRGGDPHSGVLEREQRVKQLQGRARAQRRKHP